jgi:general stress protein 26
MTDQADIEQKLWKSLESDMTVMLGLTGEEGHAQPMTAQFDGDAGRGPIYFFTSKETDLARNLEGRCRAAIHYSSKDHDVFACIEGTLEEYNDRATIDRLWNKFVAAWYEEGKDDPKLLLVRFEPDEAQVWLNESSLLAGVKVMLGRDPKKDYDDKVTEFRM